MNYQLIFIVTCALFTCGVTYASNCIHRDYGYGASVCVCNETYCDSLEPIVKTENGLVQSYVTSIGGDRLTRTDLHFEKVEHQHESINVTVTINSEIKYHKIVGFGGAFTDAAGFNIVKLPKSMQTRLIEDYYGSDGIEYRIARVPMGGCDFSTRPYTYDDHPNDFNLSKFALQSEDLQYKIPYLKMAQEASSDRLSIFASPWGPPAWMKENGKINEGGFLIGAPGEKYYKTWAKYYVKFLDEYTKHNISIWAITILNEPEVGFIQHFGWNSLALNATLERDFIKLDLIPELHRNGYTKDKLKLIILDGQISWVGDFANTILGDETLKDNISGIGYHWYLNFIANRTEVDVVSRKFPDHFLLSTEACQELYGEELHLGEWKTFNRYVDDIIKDLNHYTSGWIDWNIALDVTGGPNWAKNNVKAPIIVNVTDSGAEYYKEPFFYGLGHFSKFLVPESVRVHHETNLNDDEDNVLLTVFQRPDNGTVLTLLNKHETPITVSVNDPKYGHLYVKVQPEALQTLLWY
ncbi:hypothetical protein RDWZM_002923 [Blomia tropicalis]|uniref:Glucosylceramidase n=1 Tax=Blomia tropicalis TaxID=40697 RepID=A0A9Q0RQC7_BLOTA|nr:hypothetical protein RDWZM_002923 [Blomia tropicalis]